MEKLSSTLFCNRVSESSPQSHAPLLPINSCPPLPLPFHALSEPLHLPFENNPVCFPLLLLRRSPLLVPPLSLFMERLNFDSMSLSSGLGQGLQWCLEPRLIEPCILGGGDRKDAGRGGGGWSFVRALDGSSGRGSRGLVDCDEVYVHPLDKSSVSKLSEKSLEMCTESLGSESGSDVSDSSDEFSSVYARGAAPRARPRELWAAKKKARQSGCGFPPPLTSISTGGSVQVQPHREGGRLVIRAVAVTEGCHFQADRSGGRLRLRLVKKGSGCGCTFGNESTTEEEEEEDTENCGGHGEETEGGAEETEQEEGDGDACDEEDMDGNCGNVGGEMETGKLPRGGKCGSGGKCGPFWGLPTTTKPISQF